MKRWISPFMMQDYSSCLVILTEDPNGGGRNCARNSKKTPHGVKGKSDPHSGHF